MDKQKLYKNIKKYRMEAGINQDTFADMMDYSDKSMISKIENGKVDLPYSKILKCAEVLNKEPDVLMGFEMSEAFSKASNDTKNAVRAVLGVKKNKV